MIPPTIEEFTKLVQHYGQAMLRVGARPDDRLYYQPEKCEAALIGAYEQARCAGRALTGH